MRQAIHQGRYYDVQTMAYAHDLKLREEQQDSIKIKHIPQPGNMPDDSVQYCLKGNDAEVFNSAGETWEHNLGEEYQMLKRRHKFRVGSDEGN